MYGLIHVRFLVPYAGMSAKVLLLKDRCRHCVFALRSVGGSGTAGLVLVLALL
jgi:hypothetical protein